MYSLWMPKMVQVRNVPDDVHEELRRRAARAGMSLSEFLLRELRELSRRSTLEEIFERVEARGARTELEEVTSIVRSLRDGRS